MSYVAYVPSGHACRLYKFSHALGFTGLFTDDFEDDCIIIVCASPERISMFRADSWVAAIQTTGHNLVLEELDWVGHHPNRRCVVYRRHVSKELSGTSAAPSLPSHMSTSKEKQGTTLIERLEDPLTTSILGELMPQFECINVSPETTSVYAGLTDSGFQIHHLQGEALGGVDAVLGHPQHNFITTAHNINVNILHVNPMKEHVLFTGIWWQPVGGASLKPAFSSCDKEEKDMFQQKLKHGMGSVRLLNELLPIIACCAKKRRSRPAGSPQLNEQELSQEYALLARRSWKAVSFYIHAGQHDAVFAVNMHEACVRWGDLCEDDSDKALIKDVRVSLTSQPTTTIRPICRKVIATANKLPEKPTEEPTSTSTSTTTTTATLSSSTTTSQTAVVDPEKDERQKHQEVVSSLFSLFHSDEENERSAFVRHITNEYLEQETIAQQFERFSYSFFLAKKQKEAVALYQTAAAAFAGKVYSQAKELFWECLKSSTCFLMASDAELSAAYYNAARALQMCSESHGESGYRKGMPSASAVVGTGAKETPTQLAASAKELFTICVQLRTEQLRNKIVDAAAVEKAKKALGETSVGRWEVGRKDRRKEGHLKKK